MRNISLFVVLLIFASCSDDRAHLKGRLIGAPDQSIYLERVTSTGVGARVDSTSTDSKGGFKFRVYLPDGQPTIFNLRMRSEIVPLLISPRERVDVTSLGDLGRGYRVSGSRESELVWKLHGILSDGAAALDSISARWLSQPDGLGREALSQAYAREYYRIKRAQIGFIVENSSSLAAVYALYQRLPGDEVLFNGDTDYVYYQMVADSVSRRYPDSRYVAALTARAAELAAANRLQGSIETEGIAEVDYPDLELSNMYGQKVRLSSLAGKVIILDYWSAALPACNANNVEMKELWSQFADKGLAVYQVSFDTSRPLWVTAVQEQQLPWTTLCDFRGESGPAVRLWNITELPANFVIDREGNIVGKNVYGERLYETISRLTAQD